MNAIVTQARRWIGTPYVHQQSCIGAGADCLGLIRGIWRAHYGVEPVSVPPYTPDWAECSGQEALWSAAERWLEPAPQSWDVGQVLLFRMRAGGIAKHLGILSAFNDKPLFIHAYSGRAVCESPLSAPWKRRCVARFVFPETLS